jgi:protocatechuate 3,4-dioxygenase beta subunit
VSSTNRREVLFLLGSTAVGTLVGCAGEAAEETAIQLPGGRSPGCVVTPQQTEGPYFVDSALNRSDIRVDPSTGLVKAGVPLALTLRVSRLVDGRCTPLGGTIVDLWQCDATGMYSDVRDARFNTVGQKFLRGHQVSDGSGLVTFQTIYPGWYPGRAVHIHFKVRTNPDGPRGHELTSQLYFDEATNDAVLKQEPYRGAAGRTTNARDGIYRNGGRELTLVPIREANGYAASFDIGILSGA